MGCFPASSQKRDTTFAPSSWMSVSAAVGNSPYKLENAKGGTNSVLFIKPGLEYYHKSGFSLSAYTYALLGDSYNGLFEYDLTPAYDYSRGKAFSFGFAYTHYFFNGNSSLEASPLTNEFFAYLNYNHFWLQPSLAIDAEAGDYIDSLGKRRAANDEDIFINLSHQFSITSILSDEDELDISPSMGLMVGTDKFVKSFGSSNFIRAVKSKNRVIKKKGKKAAKKIYTNTYSDPQAKFIPRYTEASLDISYFLGILTIEPQYFFDIPLTKGEIAANYFLIVVSLNF
ncbi:MAG: hypothetical protein ACRDE2_17295 [Chitinophagaceae bacterium]